MLYHLSLVDTVGYLGNDNDLMPLVVLDVGLGPYGDGAASGAVGAYYAGPAVDLCSGGEVRSRNI